MNKFAYKAWDDNFKIIDDTIEEDSVEVALEKIKSKGLKVIHIKKKSSLADSKIFKPKIKYSEIASFCGQTAIIINSGVNIITGLEVLQKQNKRIDKIISQVLEGVRKGETLALSMKKTEAFPTLLVDMVSSGELSGNVDEVLFSMESYYEREANLKSKVKSASVYPAILLSVSLLMIVFANFFIFTRLKQLFTDGNELPLITRVLFGIIDYFNSHYIIVFSLTIGMIILFFYLKTIPIIRKALDKFYLKIPVVGQVSLDVISTRFSRSMAIFLRSAVPLLSSFDSVQMLLGNSFISEKIGKAKSEILNGSKIADALEREKAFDALLIQMVRVGEETGNLEDMLFKLADIYDKRVDMGISRMISLVEPVFTLIIGLFVGFVIIAVALPIMQMSNIVG